jgi:hypothetical protein
MQQSESIAALAAALAKVQAVLEGAKLDSENPFFKSKYSDLTSVWAACRKPLAENGLAVIQTCSSETPEIVIVETMLCHSSGEWVKGKIAMKPVKADPQGIGSCITYARRYSLAAMVGVAPEDDDGNAASHSNKMEKPPPKNTEPDVPENLGTPPNLTNFETKTTYLKEVRIAEGISKSGKNKGKPFSRYDVIDEDDKLYGTFDAIINDRAKAAIYNKALVKITYQVGQYGNNLMGMVVERVDIP